MEFDFQNRNGRIYKEDVFINAVQKYLFRLTVKMRVSKITKIITLI